MPTAPHRFNFQYFFSVTGTDRKALDLHLQPDWQRLQDSTWKCDVTARSSEQGQSKTSC